MGDSRSVLRQFGKVYHNLKQSSKAAANAQQEVDRLETKLAGIDEEDRRQRQKRRQVEVDRLETKLAGIDEEDRRQRQKRHQVQVELATAQTALKNTCGNEGWQSEVDSAGAEAARVGQILVKSHADRKSAKRLCRIYGFSGIILLDSRAPDAMKNSEKLAASSIPFQWA